jgi:hypothetical protein
MSEIGGSSGIRTAEVAALIGPLPGPADLAEWPQPEDGLVATRCAIVAICSSGRQ